MIAFAVIGFIAALLGGSLFFLIGNDNPHGNSSSSSGATTASQGAVRRLPQESISEIGAVEGKPQFNAPPALTLDTGKSFQALLELEEGVVRIELFDDVAPLHVNNFVFLSNEGFYDGLTFHRVVPDFVAQAGDPTARGSGGAGYDLPDEDVGADPSAFSLGAPGIIAMARSGRGASSSQFFITLTPQERLDALGFTAFGRVIDGLGLLQQLPDRDPAQLPAPPAGARILSITIQETGSAAATGPADAVPDDGASAAPREGE